MHLILIAGGGSMVGAIRGSTQQEPLVVGKPSTFMMDYLSNKYDNQAKSIHFKKLSFTRIFSVLR
jgi:ribonucleotide monophosphatase NagD (HAD superfamily)